MLLSKKLKTYISILVSVSIIILAYLVYSYKINNLNLLLFLSALSIITESLLIPISNGIAVSVGFAISLTAILTGGPLVGALVSISGIIFRVPHIEGRGYVHIFKIPFHKTLVNISQSIISTSAAGIVYILAGGQGGEKSFILNIFPVIYAILIYVLLNTSILTFYFTLVTEYSFIDTWLKHFKGILLNAVIVGLLGVVIAFGYMYYGFLAVIILIGPLLLARYSYKLYMNMRSTYMETVKALTNSLEAKDAYTKGHASRVQHYAVKLAKSLELKEKQIDKISTAAILHDIGKIGVKDEILNKPGKLTDEEYDQIKKHSTIGSNILKDVHFLKDVSKMVRHHHERYDGLGYPDGLKGSEIPVEAAILAIADVYDAMTSDRPYRKALTVDTAIQEIEKNKGTQFDPKLADAFIEIIKEEKEGATA